LQLQKDNQPNIAWTKSLNPLTWRTLKTNIFSWTKMQFIKITLQSTIYGQFSQFLNIFLTSSSSKNTKRKKEIINFWFLLATLMFSYRSWWTLIQHEIVVSSFYNKVFRSDTKLLFLLHNLSQKISRTFTDLYVSL
jgi:hypothetical protein